MPLEEDRPKAKYNCSQPALYAALNMLWNNYTTHQPALEARSTIYTAAFGTAATLAVQGAQELPDEQARNATHQISRQQLKQLGDLALVEWGFLKEYILHAYADADEAKARLEAAGQTYYEEAANENWDHLTQLLQSGTSFITGQGATLQADGGMPGTFPADHYEPARGNFNNKYAVFMSAQLSAPEQRDMKINANNAIYETGLKMAKFARKVFRNQPAIRDKFVWSRLLELVGEPEAAFNTELNVTLINGATNEPLGEGEGTVAIVATGDTDDTDGNGISEFDLLLDENLTTNLIATAPGFADHTEPDFEIVKGEVNELVIVLSGGS